MLNIHHNIRLFTGLLVFNIQAIPGLFQAIPMYIAKIRCYLVTLLLFNIYFTANLQKYTGNYFSYTINYLCSQRHTDELYNKRNFIRTRTYIKNGEKSLESLCQN